MANESREHVEPVVRRHGRAGSKVWHDGHKAYEWLQRWGLHPLALEAGPAAHRHGLGPGRLRRGCFRFAEGFECVACVIAPAMLPAVSRCVVGWIRALKCRERRNTHALTDMHADAFKCMPTKINYGSPHEKNI